jgi:CubicO group peptidase (beta-lactamase class C family)
MTAVAKDAPHGAPSGKPAGSPRTSAPAAARLRHDPSLLDETFVQLQERVKSGALPAAALAIGDLRGEIRSEAFTTDKRGLSTDSMFFLASVTKPIFATAFMQLVDDGLLALEDPVARHIKGFANAPGKADITPWHLLTHTSGVPDVSPEVIRRSRPSAAQMTHMAIDSPLHFAPGSRYEYCSVSFYLLAEMIQRLTHISYTEYLQTRLLDPLGMRTTFDPRRSARPVVAVEGAGVDSRVMRFLVTRYLARAALPGGGLFGTLDDLLRFGAAFLGPRKEGDRYVPLSPASIKVMIQDHLRGVPGNFDGQERAVHFGLGWGKPTLMRDVPGSADVVSHGGASGTRLWIDPVAGLVIVFFTNQWSPDRATETEAIRGTYDAMGWEQRAA